MKTVIKTGYANVYRENSFSSMLVTQGIVWEKVDILQEIEDWINIRLPDGYEGWCQRFSLQELDEEMEAVYSRNKRITVQIPHTEIKSYSDRDNGYERKGIAVFGGRYPIRRVNGNWTEIYLPDGQFGWIQQQTVSEMPARDKVMYFAEKMIGTSYFWGGKSENGFDCSGFVQSVFGVCGMQVPRDASMQKTFLEKYRVAGADDVKKGDLAFFQKPDGRISHVAIMMEPKRFIHSSGEVKINSVDPEAADYSEKLKNMLEGIYSIESLT